MKVLKPVVLLILVFGLSACKLSGTASGIDGVLTIQDNETGEVLKLDQDGSFEFSNDYKAGDKYSLVAQSDNQFCRVGHGSGRFSSSDIDNVRITCEDEPTACTAIFDPVCAIESTDIVCVTTPCNPLHNYKTFSNACMASAASAQIIHDGECGDKEGQSVRDISMIRFATTLRVQSDPVTVNEVSLINDWLIFNVSYSGGCESHEFTLYGDTDFGGDESARSDQVELFHSSNGDLCERAITRALAFSLLPLKDEFKTSFEVEFGTVLLNITAPGSIPPDSRAPLTTYEETYRFDDRNQGSIGTQCGGLIGLPCEAGLECKTEEFVADGFGVCQVQDYCFSDDTAGFDCRNLIHIAIPGQWTCSVANQCFYQADSEVDSEVGFTR
ncbi:MAG: hypothetical protein COB04_06080 [Gammaproteobacteria bacterium]|nr:MAG: hypothetical protein COB04_06080 [Gammaproteobacteria bacterium]